MVRFSLRRPAALQPVADANRPSHRREEAAAKIAPLNNENRVVPLNGNNPPRSCGTPRRLAGADLKCGERDPLGAISPPDFASPTALAMASAHLWASPPWREEAAARGWSCRGEMWVRRAGATPPPGRYAACVAASGWCPAESRRDIDKAVPRTFGLGGMNLRELEPHLRRVLMAYAVADPETAYCQGMGFVAGAALLPFVTESQPPSAADEERAFAWLGFMVNGPLAGCYSSGMAGLAAHQQALRELLQRRRPALVAHLDDLGCPIECFTAPLLLKGFQQLPLPLALEAMDLLAARRVSALQLVLAVCEHAAPAMTRAKDAIDVQNALAQACDMRMRLRTLVDAHVGGRERCMRRRSVRCRRCPRYLPVRQSPARADSGAAGPRCVSCEPEGADADGCGCTHECVTVSLLPPPPLVPAPPPPASWAAAVQLQSRWRVRAARVARARLAAEGDVAVGAMHLALEAVSRVPPAQARRAADLLKLGVEAHREGRAARACDLLQLGLHAAAAHEDEVVITSTRTTTHENEDAAGSPPRPYSLPLNVLLTLATLRLKPGEAHAPAAALAACEFILSADAAPLEPSPRQLELAARKWREARAVLVWQKTDAQLAALVEAIC